MTMALVVSAAAVMVGIGVGGQVGFWMSITVAVAATGYALCPWPVLDGDWNRHQSNVARHGRAIARWWDLAGMAANAYYVFYEDGHSWCFVNETTPGWYRRLEKRLPGDCCRPMHRDLTPVEAAAVLATAPEDWKSLWHPIKGELIQAGRVA